MVIAKGKPVHARRFKKRQAELEIDRARLQISNVRGDRAASEDIARALHSGISEAGKVALGGF